MKPEEAIDELSRMKRTVNFQSRIAGSGGVEIFIDNDYRDDFISTMDSSIQALEKQVAKKPLRIYNTLEDYDLCPECLQGITEEDNPHGCSYCLQKIDWSED